MKMTFTLNNFWYGVRQYKAEFAEIHDDTTEDNATVTSSNISQNDGTTMILMIFKKLTYFSNHEDDIQSSKILVCGKISR